MSLMGTLFFLLLEFTCCFALSLFLNQLYNHKSNSCFNEIYANDGVQWFNQFAELLKGLILVPKLSIWAD